MRIPTISIKVGFWEKEFSYQIEKLVWTNFLLGVIFIGNIVFGIRSDIDFLILLNLIPVLVIGLIQISYMKRVKDGN